MFVWTETPLTELWNHMRYLQSPTNVRNLLSGATPSERKDPLPNDGALEKRALELASCIRQASEYYRAAEQVTLSTQPLLQYYGALALAKAAILANTDATLVDLRYHGLSTRPTGAPADVATRLTGYANDPSVWQLENEYGVVQPQGVFSKLCHAAGEPSPPPATVLALKDLMRQHPDMARLFVRHYAEPSNCFYMEDWRPDERRHLRLVFLHHDLKADYITKVFPELTTDFDGGAFHFISKNPQSLPLPYARTLNGTVAGTYLVRPHVSGLFGTLPVTFAALFVLSNVVRYKPAFWMETLEGRNSGAASIAEAFCNASRRRYPNDVLNCIWQEPFEFGAPGRFA